MIVTDKFIYIRLQKCASTTLTRYFTDAYNGKAEGEGHVPAIKAIDRKLPLVASIRNPFEWYVSWHAFIKNDKRYEEIYHKNFKRFMLGIYSCKEKCFPWCDFSEMNKQDIGVYTFRYKLMCTDDWKPLIKYWIRVRYIDEDLDKLSAIFPVINDIKVKRYNKSRHQDYSKYYDGELIELVFRKERRIINLYSDLFVTKFGDIPDYKTLKFIPTRNKLLPRYKVQ